MIGRCGKFIVVIALVLTTGLHWVALQSIAWTTMLASNLQTQSVSEAICHTFDGKHPCCMCKAIAAGKKSEKKSDADLSKAKFEYLASARNSWLFPPARFNLMAVKKSSAESIFLKPPLPPPRCFFA